MVPARLSRNLGPKIPQQSYKYRGLLANIINGVGPVMFAVRSGGYLSVQNALNGNYGELEGWADTSMFQGQRSTVTLRIQVIYLVIYHHSCR